MDPLSSLALLSAAFLASALLHRGLGKWGIPAILLELCLGFAIGNWIASPSQVGSILGAAELGVLVLFFMVGLETDPHAIFQHKASVLRVAALSVSVSAIGFLILRNVFGLPEGEPLIVAATIMTSGTGMAMRLMREHGAVATPSGRILLGASVLDDFPAILLLATAFAVAKGQWTGHLSWLSTTLAGLGPLGCILLVLFLIRQKQRFWFRPVHAIPLLVLGAWATHSIGLTSLLGALVVGMTFRSGQDEHLETFLQPFSLFLIPLYFITVGMRIPFSALAHLDGWLLGLGLFCLAFLGRLVCSIGVTTQDIKVGADRSIIMWGMVPRGLPGLVFATMAQQAGLLSGTTFLGLVLMVTLTNLIGLAGMFWRLRKLEQKIFRGI